MSEDALEKETSTGPTKRENVESQTDDTNVPPAEQSASSNPISTAKKPKEVGGRDGPDPVRYGDWEKGGRCIDF